MHDDLNAIRRNGAAERERLLREFKDHPKTEHCSHNAAQPFVAVPPGAMGPGAGPVLAQPKTCCWCGPLRVHYIGLLEPGHGPFVTYDPSAVQVDQQPRIYVPQ